MCAVRMIVNIATKHMAAAMTPMATAMDAERPSPFVVGAVVAPVGEADGAAEGDADGASVLSQHPMNVRSLRGQHISVALVRPAARQRGWARHAACSVGDSVGAGVGLTLGDVEGEALGLEDGLALGLAVGLREGLVVGLCDGEALGLADGLDDGAWVGLPDGIALGLVEGLWDGSGVGGVKK